MTVAVHATTIEILGKTYQLKCAPEEKEAIHAAARLVQEKLQTVRETTHLLSNDRVAIMAALSIAHEMQALAKSKSCEIQDLNARLYALQNDIDAAMTRWSELELATAP